MLDLHPPLDAFATRLHLSHKTLEAHTLCTSPREERTPRALDRHDLKDLEPLRTLVGKLAYIVDGMYISKPASHVCLGW